MNRIMANNTQDQTALIASFLRVGMGLLFVIGGLSKLSLLLNSTTHDGMVANYMGTAGYINTLFQAYLFSDGSLLTPSGFLTTLSAFELVSGFFLIVGFMVRPLALFYGFLLWSFVVALPVHTVPGVEVDVKTYTSPAIFVQIRDITLSGMMFVLFNLGAGVRSLDNKLFPHTVTISWESLGLLLRFSLGVTFIVGGFFGGFHKVPSFATAQWLLAVIGLLLVFGNPALVRAAGVGVVAVMLVYMLQKLTMDKSIIANLNSIKREFALIAAGIALLVAGGGMAFTAQDLLTRSKRYIFR
ncbi:DoxX family membrane protein [Endozoicomonas ascidiicola]|uniref:DoxX family membrane protein n=1 Tax=Endozoicomonas ascidiicola TaxID=1698521 RepID=UPI000834F518|nr:DoxX family membrane protein [Endozoicomonas ascidiicola]